VSLHWFTSTFVYKNLTTRCQTLSTTELPVLWRMLCGSISIQSPTRSRLPGTQAHAEQINVNPTAWFP